MLVIRRKVGERIMIGEEIEVVVSDLGPGWVALAIDAPREVDLRRGPPREEFPWPSLNKKRRRRVVIADSA